MGSEVDAPAARAAQVDDEDLEKQAPDAITPASSQPTPAPAFHPNGSSSSSADPPSPPLGEYNYPEPKVLSGSLSGCCPAPCWYRRRIGRFYVLHETAKGQPVVIMGPCWPMFFVTFSVIATVSGLVIGGLGRNYVEILVIGCVLAFVTLTAFCLTGCRNPGIVKRRQEQLSNDELYDERAKSFRPLGSIYEYETGTLIRDVDHFCPWTSVSLNILCAPCVCARARERY